METGRITIEHVKVDVVNGRREETREQYYTCWCEVKSLSSTEAYSALQTGLSTTILFEVRRCKKIESMRLNQKEYEVNYKGTRLKIYSVTPMFVDSQKVQIKCTTEE